MRGVSSGDSADVSPAGAGLPPGGRFWALASASSDEEEEGVPRGSSSTSRSLRYRCRTSEISPTRDLPTKRFRKREEKTRRQRWAAREVNPSLSPSLDLDRVSISSVRCFDHADSSLRSVAEENCFLHHIKVPVIISPPAGCREELQEPSRVGFDDGSGSGNFRGK